MSHALIYDGVRSPRSRAKSIGSLATIPPQELLSQLYAALLERTDLAPQAIEDVILGCVTQSGEQGGNIARTSILYAGWPAEVPGLTVNRYCSSGIDALALAAMKITSGNARQLLAGGVEMMSRVPMLSDQPRAFIEPEFAASSRIVMMGNGADLVASKHNISREQADHIALLSQQRAATAREEGRFSKSIVPIKTENGTAKVDECIRDTTSIKSLAALPLAFTETGAAGVDAYQLAANPDLSEIQHIHTVGNSPAMADGACVILIGDNDCAKELGAAPRAAIRASISVASDPYQVLTGCITATEKLLEKTQLSVNDIDLFEIHEAFAATSVLAMQRLGIEEEKLNVNGGVIALGHPMGATGAMMTLTLLDELERRNLRRGIVAAAGAAGSGAALLIDREVQ